MHSIIPSPIHKATYFPGLETHISLVHPLQSPAACTPQEHQLNPSYDDTQFPTLLQCTPPPSPPSRLTH